MKVVVKPKCILGLLLVVLKCSTYSLLLVITSCSIFTKENLRNPL